jgi:hypothetical protein
VQGVVGNIRERKGMEKQRKRRDMGKERRERRGRGWRRRGGKEDHPGDNPGANRWFLQSNPIQMLLPGGGICGRLT